MRIVTGLIGIALTLAAGFLVLSRAGGSLVTLSYDIPISLRPGETSDQVRIVYIDELDGLAVDRENQAALLDKLAEAGARAVIYDLVFDLPSKDPEVDKAFAAAMLRFRGVDENWEPIPGAPQRSVFLACGRQSFEQTGVIVERLIPPNDELLAAADDFGLVTLVHDKNFTVRELVNGTPDEPSLVWKAASALGGNFSEDDRLSIKRWINYLGPPRRPGDDPNDPDKDDSVRAILSLRASEVLDGVPSLLRDKVVVVGAKPGILGAEAGLDLFATPYNRFDRSGTLPLLSGLEIQATCLVNLMNGNWLTRSGMAFDNWMIVIAGIIGGLVLSWARPVRAMMVAVGAMVLLLVVSLVVMYQANFWFPWTAVAFAQVPVALVWGMGSHFYIERFFRVKLSEEQKMLKEAFEKYLSPQMLERLTEDGFQMKFGGEKVSAAMMFTDLESFTNMCEKVGDPERIVEALSDYFERTTEHIFDHEGVVIKFIGDAIFAAWGAPIPDVAAPIKAARAAWHLSQNDQLVVEGVNLRTRIGVHYGEVVAGNIGSRKRVDYTMIGDAVNLSARLESLNKAFGTRILISEEVRRHLGDEFITRKVGVFKVKGRKEPTVAHELLGPAAGVEVPAWLAGYHDALAALGNDDFESARRFFAETDRMRGEEGDGPSRFYLALLDRGAEINSGVFEMTEK